MSSNSVCLNFRSSAKYNVGFCWYDEWQSLLQALKCYTMIAICKIKNFPFASKITGLKNVDFKTPQWNNGCWWIFFSPHTHFFMLRRITWIKFHLKYAFVMQTKLLFKSSHQTATRRNSREKSCSFIFIIIFTIKNLLWKCAQTNVFIVKMYTLIRELWKKSSVISLFHQSKHLSANILVSEISSW